MKRATALILLFIIPLVGCHKWVELDRSPAATADTTTLYDRIRVHRADGSTLVLHEARFTADSLVGYDMPPIEPEARRIAVPKEEARRTEVRRPDALNTTLTVIGAAFGAVFLGVIVCAATDCVDMDPLFG